MTVIVAGILTQHTPSHAATSVASSSISVSGAGIVTVVPAMAVVTVGAQITSSSAAHSQDRVNRIIAGTVTYIRALGIAVRDIATEALSLSPQTDQNGRVTGYQAAQTLSITVHRLSLATKVIDTGVSAGANFNVGITFSDSNTESAHVAALKLAVAQARARAQAIASTLGRSLAGAHVQVQQSSTIQGPPVYLGNAARGLSQSSAPAPTAVYPGTLTIEEDVTVTYLL